jgi:hypothetical protein
VYFCICDLMELFIRAYHGRFLDLEATGLVVVSIFNNLCFEMVFSRKWVCDTADYNHS